MGSSASLGSGSTQLTWHMNYCNAKYTYKIIINFIHQLLERTMLILSRCIGEKVVVGESIFFTVLGTQGAHVRLGIEAPADMSIHREEIFLQIKAAQEE